MARVAFEMDVWALKLFDMVIGVGQGLPETAIERAIKFHALA
jgi:hypothetical protein